MSNVGREMLTITPRNNRAERAAWFLNFGWPIEERCPGIFKRQ